MSKKDSGNVGNITGKDIRYALPEEEVKISIITLKSSTSTLAGREQTIFCRLKKMGNVVHCSKTL